MEPAHLINQKGRMTPLASELLSFTPEIAFNFTDRYQHLRQPVWRPYKKEDRRQKNKR